MTDVLIIAELLDGASRTTTRAAITAAREMTAATGGSFDILCVGADAAGAASSLTGYGARKVMTAEVAGAYIGEHYAPVIVETSKQGYGVVVAPASSFGKDLMPRVAARLDAGFASDITGIASEGGTLHYKRPMYAGNLFGWLRVDSDIQVVTVRQSAFDAAEESGGSSTVENVEASMASAAEKIEFVSIMAVQSDRPDLAEADVVVSGGRAFKSAENFENILEPLVDSMGAAMGASRAACDAGYVSNDLQVGQTGKVVAPKLYIAVGISGAIQHLAGMKGSKVIVAVNKDAEAPIAKVSDYFLVADLFDAVPQLTNAVQSLKASQ